MLVVASNPSSHYFSKYWLFHAACLQEVTVSADSLAPVALLHPTSFHVEAKQGQLQEAGEVVEVGSG